MCLSSPSKVSQRWCSKFSNYQAQNKMRHPGKARHQQIRDSPSSDIRYAAWVFLTTVAAGPRLRATVSTNSKPAASSIPARAWSLSGRSELVSALQSPNVIMLTCRPSFLDTLRPVTVNDDAANRAHTTGTRNHNPVRCAGDGAAPVAVCASSLPAKMRGSTRYSVVVLNDT